MKAVLLTPGTGSYYCGVCMRDNALAKEVIRQGHQASMLPMYLPLTLDETAVSSRQPKVFFGGINVYLQQKFSFFRNSPRWLDRLLNYRGFLKLAASRGGMTDGAELGEITLSMLKGEDGYQAKELEELIQWLKLHERPDAVWLSTALLAGLAHRIVADLGIPVVCSLQGEDAFLDELPEPWRSDCWQTLSKRAADIAALVAPSRYYGDLMQRRMRVAPAAMHVIPNGIDLTGYEEPARPGENPVIGYLARLSAGKGIDLVVDAFIELRRRNVVNNARLCCVGAMTASDEQLVSSLERKLSGAGLLDSAEFHPNVTREEKIALLSTMSLLTVPTRYGEAFGLFSIEALAAGVPLALPRVAAFPEIVEATGGGILFDEMTPASCAGAWESLLTNPSRCRELGLRGREAVFKDYSITRLAERYIQLTTALAERRETPAHAVASA